MIKSKIKIQQLIHKFLEMKIVKYYNIMKTNVQVYLITRFIFYETIK